MCASWLAVLRPHCYVGYGVIRMDAGPLDILADDPASHHVLCNDVCDALTIDMIIQSGGAPRTRQRGKPGTERWHCLAGEDLSHQHVRALGAAPEAALPHELRVLL